MGDGGVSWRVECWPGRSAPPGRHSRHGSAPRVSALENLRHAEPGNKLAATHRFYLRALDGDDLIEVEEYAASLREASPAVQDGMAVDALIEVVAVQRWRLQRGWQEIARNGLTRGARNVPAPILNHLSALETRYVENLARLGLTPQAAADLGLSLIRAQRELLDLGRLTATERTQLEGLLSKAGAILPPGKVDA